MNRELKKLINNIYEFKTIEIEYKLEDKSKVIGALTDSYGSGNFKISSMGHAKKGRKTVGTMTIEIYNDTE